MYVCICVYMCINVYMYIYIYMYVCIYIYTYTYVCVYVYIHVCVCIYIERERLKHLYVYIIHIWSYGNITYNHIWNGQQITDGSQAQFCSTSLLSSRRWLKSAENNFKASILSISPERCRPSEVPPSGTSAPGGRCKMGTGKQPTKPSRLGICVDTLRSGRPDPQSLLNAIRMVGKISAPVSNRTTDCLHSTGFKATLTWLLQQWHALKTQRFSRFGFVPICSNLKFAVQWLAVFAREISTIRFRAVAFPPLPSACMVTTCYNPSPGIVHAEESPNQLFTSFHHQKTFQKVLNDEKNDPLLRFSLLFHLTFWVKYPCEETVSMH